jgi:hypothetical protein
MSRSPVLHLPPRTDFRRLTLSADPPSRHASSPPPPSRRALVAPPRGSFTSSGGSGQPRRTPRSQSELDDGTRLAPTSASAEHPHAGSARWDLCGGPSVRAVRTAIRLFHPASGRDRRRAICSNRSQPSGEELGVSSLIKPAWTILRRTVSSPRRSVQVVALVAAESGHVLGSRWAGTVTCSPEAGVSRVGFDGRPRGDQ